MDGLLWCVFFKVLPADENSDMTVNVVLWVADTQLSTTEVQHKMTFGFVYEKKYNVGILSKLFDVFWDFNLPEQKWATGLIQSGQVVLSTCTFTYW